MSFSPHLDGPRSHRDSEEIERKLQRLNEPHIAPLTSFVDRLRTSKPDAHIPYLDPPEAGIGASILVLLEAPGRRSALVGGSGFVSADNDDQTAQNLWELLGEAGIDRRQDIVTWNVVPWYIGDGIKIRAARSSDLEEAKEATRSLLGLLPKVRVAVLLGRKASRAWDQLDADLEAIEAPHPSPLNINARPAARDEIRETLICARDRAGN